MSQSAFQHGRTGRREAPRQHDVLRHEAWIRRNAVHILARIAKLQIDVASTLHDPQTRSRLAFQLQNEVCDLILVLTREGH